MKIAAIATAISIAGTGLTFAADLPLKAPPPAVAPVITWTGFYIGLNAGGTWDGNHSVDTLGQVLPLSEITAASLAGARSATIGNLDEGSLALRQT